MAFLSWNGSPGAWAYSVKRSILSGGPYTRLATGIEAAAYVDSGLANGRTLYYVVSAFNGLGEGPNSAEVAVVPTPVLALPDPPSGVSSVGGDARVIVSWVPSAGATRYDVKRGTASGGPYATILGGPLVATTYTDLSVTNGTPYFYVVSAQNSLGTSPDSPETSATPVAPPSVPLAPDGLTGVPGDTQVALTWSAAAGATSYNLYRGLFPAGPYTLVINTQILETIDRGLTDGTTYYYLATSVNSLGESAPSSGISATPIAPALPPPPPDGLLATPGNSQVSLSWNETPEAAGYRVYRATVPGGPYAPIVAVPVSLYTDIGLTNDLRYYYVVTAVNSAGESPASSEVSAAPAAAAPAAPLGVQAAPGNMAVGLRWTASPGATLYNVKRSETPGGPYQTIGQTSDVQFGDTGLVNGTTYYYVISGVNLGWEGPNSAEVSATPYLAAPMPVCGATGWEALLLALLLLRGQNRRSCLSRRRC
jgi:fibronectin type 3 domain-containing protein